MPRKKSGKTKRRPRRSASGNPPTSAIRYMGPIVNRAELGADQTVIVVSTYASDLASSVGAVIANVYGNDPSSLDDWSSLVAAWAEYRVLGTMFEFYPQNKYSKTTTLTRPLCHVISRDSSSALSGYGIAAAYDSFIMLSLDDETKHGSKDYPAPIARMTSTDESDFLSTASPSAKWWHKLYADTVSASTTYGLVFITYRIQFRTRR